MPRSCWASSRWALSYWAPWIAAGIVSAACSPFSRGCSEDTLAGAVGPSVGIESSLPVSTRIVALGQIKPKGEVSLLSVPNAHDSRVN